MTKSKRKLIKVFDQADTCISRKQSKKLIVKAQKLQAKILAKKLLSCS